MGSLTWTLCARAHPLRVDVSAPLLLLSEPVSIREGCDRAHPRDTTSRDKDQSAFSLMQRFFATKGESCREGSELLIKVYLAAQLCAASAASIYFRTRSRNGTKATAGKHECRTLFWDFGDTAVRPSS